MKLPVVVTGASGFVGKHLVAALISRGWLVHPHSFADGDIAHGELTWPECCHVFHLAARSFVPDSWADPRRYYEVNVTGTVNVLEFCRRTGASMTFVSSYVYGAPVRLPIAEDHPLCPLNPYSHTKLLAEEVCRFYVEHYGLRVSIIRPFNIYGPGQDERFLIPTLIRQVLNPDTDFVEVADLRPKRDFLYVSDLVRLLLAAMAGSGCGVYNAGSGCSLGIQQIVDILNELAPRAKTLISRNEFRPGEVLDVAADIRKAECDLHWTPETNLRAGLARTLAVASGSEQR
jgi:nucleoside-diphosphate-sugar epimerase